MMTTDPKDTGFRIKGWHVLAGFVGAFGIIISVNIALAVNAVRTFPGLESDNSYLASQTFDTRRDAQLALGWEVAARLQDGRVVLTINDAKGYPVRVTSLETTLGRPTNVVDDISPAFDWDGTAYVADADLAPGNWDLWIKAQAENGTVFEQRLEMTMGR
ncbi:FixH family protein [Sagittula sp. NFXS13]|uniref:FixH family protein n=1 Tax=Sagittula sp. NFXS13 TaxID=2819095 RepID=UPI0032DFCC34